MSNVASVLDVNRISNLVRSRCDNAGVTVQFIEGLQTAETDGKNIRLPALLQPITKEQLEITYGFTIHECGHHSRPEAFDILNGAKPNQAIAAMFNVTEDDGMEREVASRWRGDAAALGRMNDLIMTKVVDNFTKELAQYEGEELNKEKIAPILALLLGQLSRLDWDGEAIAQLQELFHDTHPDIKDNMEALIREGWVEKFQDTRTPFDTWDLAIDLFKRLYDLNDEESEQLERIRANGHAAGEGENIPHPDDTLTEVGGSQGDGGAGGLNAKAEGTVVSWKDVVLSEHDEWTPKDGESGNLGIDWTDYVSDRGVGLMPTDMVKVYDLKNCGSFGDGFSYMVPSQFKAKSADSRSLGNKLRRYLQSQARVQHDPEKRHGKLDKRGLVRLALPPIDGGEWNKKIFYRNRLATTKDTAIIVMVDWSGSMDGTKMSYAADAAGRLILICDRVLKMPVQVAAFTNGRTPCDVGLVKKFSERSVSNDEIATRFHKFYGNSAANNDADSLNWAYHEILKRPESRKIIMMLSDGCPAGEWAGHGHDNLLYLTGQIEKDPRVELYGVGICSNAVETYYKTCKVLNNADEISKTIFDIVKEGDYNAKRNRQGN